MGLTNLRSESLSKADRKFEKKLKFYEKVRETVTEIAKKNDSLSAKKTVNKKRAKRREKKLKPYDLSALSELLPELKEAKQPAAPAELKLNSKSRHKLVLKETERLKSVINHPSFQADPLAAIGQHLLNTQPVIEEKPPKKANVNGKKRKKGKKSKSSAGPLAMEM